MAASLAALLATRFFLYLRTPYIESEFPRSVVYQIRGYAMAHVFISHRGSDSPQAEQLAVALRDRGHVVRLDTWELTTGDSIVGWMNDALSASRILVLCYSSHGIDAPFIRVEWESFLSRMLSGEPLHIIPVYLTGNKAPAILHGRKAADWMTNPHIAMKDIEAAIAKYATP